jgi:hypothetical protein
LELSDSQALTITLPPGPGVVARRIGGSEGSCFGTSRAGAEAPRSLGRYDDDIPPGAGVGAGVGFLGLNDEDVAVGIGRVLDGTSRGR